MFVGNQGALAPHRWVNIVVLPLRVMADTRAPSLVIGGIDSDGKRMTEQHQIMQLQMFTVKLGNEIMDLMDRVAKLELEAKENEN